MSNSKEFAKSYKLRKKAPKDVDKGKYKKDYKKSDQQAFIERRKNLKKSTYDFRDVKVSVDSTQHATAEATAPKELVEYLQSSANSDLEKVPLAKGTLTMYKKEQGLFSGFFQDSDGQVVEKFDDMTIPILAKNLEIKQLYTPASIPSQHDEEGAIEDAAIAADVAAEFIRNHNEAYHKGQEPGEPINNGKGSLRLRMGDIDIEIRKSINGFVSDFKKKKDSKQVEVIKAIQSWRRNSVSGKSYKNDLEAAQALLRDWDKLSEEFHQVMYAMKVGNE